MIDEICAEINNYFISKILHGEYKIINGTLSLENELKDGQYYRICGSAMNDGVYIYPSDNLSDEIFCGSVWCMNVPPSFVQLSTEIESWCNSEAAKPSPFTSESFGGYSYTKATDSSGIAVTWQSVFRNKLNRYRRISIL